MIIIGIDPGPEKSGYVEFNTNTAVVSKAMHEYNWEICGRLKNRRGTHVVVVEMPACYGMAVGATVLETCVAVGRIIESSNSGQAREFRKSVAATLCGQAKAKGPYIRQCIIDMYGEGAIGGKRCKKCKGKKWTGRDRKRCTECNGTGWKEPPGPLYGVTTHAWDALAVALAYAINAGYLNPLVVNPGGLGSNFQSPAHDGLSGLQIENSTPQDEPF